MYVTPEIFRNVHRVHFMYLCIVYTLQKQVHILQIMYIFSTCVFCTHMYSRVNVQTIPILYIYCDMSINVHMSKSWDIIFSILDRNYTSDQSGFTPRCAHSYTCTCCAYYVLMYRMYMSTLYIHRCTQHTYAHTVHTYVHVHILYIMGA